MLILLSVAGINLITKRVATISGVAFTLVFFLIFLLSERVSERKRARTGHVQVDQFRLNMQEIVANETVQVRPGNVLCLVRDYNTLHHIRRALETVHPAQKDLLVMTVHLLKGPNTGYKDLREEHVFTDYEQLLFSRVVALAEKAGKHVHLLVVPSSDIFEAIAQTAMRLNSTEIIAGRSSVMTAEEQSRRIGEAWEKLPRKPSHQVRFQVIDSEGRTQYFYLGAHVPKLSEKEVNLIHKIWLDITREPGQENVHHKDIVTIALARLDHDLKSEQRRVILGQLQIGVPGEPMAETALLRE